MNSQSNWYDGIEKRINQLKETLGENDYKKYKLNLLLCVAQRVAEFSLECGQCQMLQQEILTLTEDVSNIVQSADKVRRKAYLKTINRMIGHLQKQHKLVTEGYYMGIGMVFSSGIGVALGVAMPSIAIGIPIGLGIGIAVGSALDAKAKKEGRVICPSEKTTTSPQRTRIMILIGLAVLFLAGLAAFMLLQRPFAL
ncbi:hypothetical protein ACFLX0_02310 [Chloroflexota bacterium]